MFKLDYPSQNGRWFNNLGFSNWSEYWKTLGYLSNPNIHKLYITSSQIESRLIFDVNIKYEHNARSHSYSDTGRIYYYGLLHDDRWFQTNFPDLYSISRPFSGNVFFRINRKDFIDTLEYDLHFIRISRNNVRDDILIPNSNNQAYNFARLHPQFDISSWQHGWDLGNRNF